MKLDRMIMLIVCIFIITACIYLNKAYLNDVSIINLDKSTDRWIKMQSELTKLNVPFERWSATDGRIMSNDEYKAQGISNLLLPKNAREAWYKRRRGEIGCYLSHRELIKSLGHKWVLPNAGHLILEDDVVIDEKCLENLNRAFPYLPWDWDILFLGIIPKLSIIESPHGGISKVNKVAGAHAYIVRHGSIPKINREIKNMFDAVDEMFWQADLNLYALQPYSVFQRDDLSSDINEW